MRDVARRIAELRETAGWTQARLAERLKMSDQYVRRLESGTVNITLKSLNRIARRLGTPVEEFFVRPLSTPPRKPGRPAAKSVSARSTRG